MGAHLQGRAEIHLFEHGIHDPVVGRAHQKEVVEPEPLQEGPENRVIQPMDAIVAGPRVRPVEQLLRPYLERIPADEQVLEMSRRLVLGDVGGGRSRIVNVRREARKEFVLVVQAESEICFAV